MHHLRGGVHAGIGAPGRYHANAFLRQFAQSSFQGALHGGNAICLLLPAEKTAAIVTNKQGTAFDGR
jgi:hypothetical protein